MNKSEIIIRHKSVLSRASIEPRTTKKEEEVALNQVITFLAIEPTEGFVKNPLFCIRGKETPLMHKLWATILWFKHISYDRNGDITGRAILKQVLSPRIDLRKLKVRVVDHRGLGPAQGNWGFWQKSKDFDYIREHMPGLMDKNSMLLKNALDNLMLENASSEVATVPTAAAVSSKVETNAPNWLTEPTAVAAPSKVETNAPAPVTPTSISAREAVNLLPKQDALKPSALIMNPTSIIRQEAVIKPSSSTMRPLSLQETVLELSHLSIERRRAALQALCASMDSDVNDKNAIRDAGAIPLVIGLLNDADVFVKQNAARVLWVLAVQHPTNQSIMASAGAIPPLVDLLSSTDTIVKQNVLGALWNLAALPANKTTIAMAGKIAPAIKLLSDSDSTVQNYAKGLLESLESLPEIRTMIDKEKIHVNIQKLSHPNVQTRREATEIVRRLAYHADAVHEFGGIVPLVKLLGDEDPSIRRDAAKALKDAASDDLNKNAIREAGGIVLLVKLLSDVDVKARYRAAGALGRMIEIRSNHHAIRTAGGIVSLVHLLKETNIKSQKEATWALAGLAVNAMNHSAICEAGGIAAFISLLDTPDETLRRDVLSALWRLAGNQPVNQTIMIDGGVLPLLNKFASTDENARNILTACQTIVENRKIEQKQGLAARMKAASLKPSMKATPSVIPMIASSSLQFDRNKKLGQGGFGIVYQGTWLGTTQVAIKQLFGQLTPDLIEEFQREAGVHARLRHPNIIALYGICVEPMKYAMVIELMANGSLYDVLKNPAELPWSLRLTMALDLASGLLYLHTQHIIHRDLKSLNILVDENMRAKVSDFGLAKIKMTSSSMTKGGGGTIQWEAPELFDEAPNSPVTDVYATGVVLWEIAARKLPYAGKTKTQIMHYVEKGHRETIPVGTPSQFGMLISRCWAQRAEDRPAIDVVARNIREIQASSSNASASSTPASVDSGYAAFSRR